MERFMPPADPGDDIIPVHLFDNMHATRSIVLVWVYKFHDIMDPQIISRALSDLFQLDGWRKLSGRFRYLVQPNGGLEIHVPQRTTKDRPAVQLTQEDHSILMSEHPVAARLPEPSSTITRLPGPRELCSLGIGPETPCTLDDFVYLAKPQFCLHAHNFLDGTLICFTHSHVTCDLMGMEAVLRAWSLVLAGKINQVPPMASYRDDPFVKILRSPARESHRFVDRVLDGDGHKLWLECSLSDSQARQNIISNTLCIPSVDMEKIMQHARQTIAMQKSYASQSEDHFISEGDVLTALAVHVLAQDQGADSTRLNTTLMALDPRSRVRTIFDKDAAYVQNSPTNIHLFFKASQVLSMTLGQLALSIRRQIQAQVTEDQVRASVVLSAQSMVSNGMPVVFGSYDMATQFMSNWTKGKYAEAMDFRPAVIRECQNRPSHSRLGHPTYYQAVDPGHSTVSVISSVFVVTMKDFGGNLWFTISMPENMWSSLMDYLGTLTGTLKASL